LLLIKNISQPYLSHQNTSAMPPTREYWITLKTEERSETLR